jgi:origin recognition complex subunit 4
MIETIKEYFRKQPKQAVLFVLEDIDYYVETTKQLLLYKILGMFGYLSQESNVRFVFLATSVKVDIVDSFEKRIKSRFSHRMTLFYEQTLEKFMENIIGTINQMLEKADTEYKRE